jgi:hypothetical protein
MPEYIERVKAEIAEKNLELTTYTGEFRDLGAANVLTGTLASRVYLKQQNAYCQALLEKKFEPLYAANTAFGLKDFPQEYGTYMWKVLIQNHPHDSICGCSVDAVHDHMMDRFIRVRENADDLVGRGTELWLNHVDRTGLNDRQYFVLCVNSTQKTYSGVMDAVVYAMECVDNGLKAIIEAADKYGYTVLITADHGNADQMTETKKGKTAVRTAHSLNAVPFIIYDKDKDWTVLDGSYGLANVAPTVVKMMGLTAPDCWEASMV